MCCQVVYYYVVLFISAGNMAKRRSGGLTRLEGALGLVGFRIARGVVSVEVDAQSMMHCLVLIVERVEPMSLRANRC